METETIKFNEMDGQDGFLIGEDTSVVNIYPSRVNQKVTNSSKVKLTSIVNYRWDSASGIGRLTASHYLGKHIAYCVKINGTGAVRVVDLDTQQRVLIRASRGLIRDVDFMHKEDEIILGFVDEFGGFYIHRITKNDNNLECELILQIEIDKNPTRLDNRRFIWCKYVPDEDDMIEDDQNTKRDPPVYQFAVIQDEIIYLANLKTFVAKYGDGLHQFSVVSSGFLGVTDHSASIVDASYSPDGTAIATASKDGMVKFFQIYWPQGSGGPRCLYTWPPHGGEPVSRILFLDDYTLENEAEVQYWKYLITAGPNMNEIKLWNCTKWECIQTLRFSSSVPNSIKIDLNYNAKFIIISDSHRKLMYVINVEHDDNTASFRWITEFSVPVTVLGFSVINAEFCKMPKIMERGFEHFLSEDMDSDLDAVIVDTIFIEPKSLMQASMAFTPPTDRVSVNGRSQSRISFDESVSFKDEDKEISEDDIGDEIVEPQKKPRKSTTPKSGSEIMSPKFQPILKSRSRDMSPLVTPRANTSPGIRNPTPITVSHLTQQLSSLIGLGSQMQNSILLPNVTNNNPFLSNFHAESSTDPTLPIEVRTSSANGNGSNASSSPSREVEEILSPKNSETMTQKSEVMAYHMSVPEFGQAALDIEGNIITSNVTVRKSASPLQSPKSKIPLPMKTKSLGAVETNIGPGSDLPQVLEQVSSIMDMMKAQAQELQELKSEVSRLNTVAQFKGSRNTSDDAVMMKLAEKFTAINEANSRRTEETMKNLLLALQEKQSIPKGFTENITLDLAHAIKTEIESSVLPKLLKVLDPVCLHLNSEIDSLIKGAELKVKQEIIQMINSQDFKSVLKDQVGNSVRTVCDEAMSDVFSTSLCPKFEKSLQGLFETINETFMMGTKQYISGVENTVKSNRTQQEDFEDTLTRQLTDMQNTLSSILQIEIESHLKQLTTSLKSQLFLNK